MNRRQFLPMIFAPAFANWKSSGAATTSAWPQWRGPERNDLSRETGLLQSWPSAGPKLAWSINGLGDGYGGVAVVDDSIFVQGGAGGQSVVHRLNRADGRTVWAAQLGPRLNQDRGGGPRGTPTIAGDHLYAVSENGDLACLRARDGSVAWRKNILKTYGGRNPGWLISESPLVDGSSLVMTPGGPSAGIVAMNKDTGQDLWTAKEISDTAGYSSCIAVTVDGVRLYTTINSAAAVGVRASDGKLMWRYERVANRVANIATPVFDKNRVFYTTAYDTGCAMLRLKADGGTVRAEEGYFNRDMMNHHGGVVLVNNHLYGFSNNILTCLDFGDGKAAWRHRSVGKGSLTYADGRLYLLGENNVVGLAKATPEGYEEVGRFSIADQGWPSWAHPVVCGGQLFLRNQSMLMCYNVKA